MDILVVFYVRYYEFSFHYGKYWPLFEKYFLHVGIYAITRPITAV